MKIKLAQFDIPSVATFQIAGRGTVKVLRDDALPKGYKVFVGDKLRIDGELCVLVGVEMTSPRRRGEFGVSVRRIEPEEPEIEDREDVPCVCGCVLGHHDVRNPYACLGPDDENPGCPNQCQGFLARDLRGIEALRQELNASQQRVRELEAGIRAHRDASGHRLCWYWPELWGLLRDEPLPEPTVPPTEEFLSHCAVHRASLSGLPVRSEDDALRRAEGERDEAQGALAYARDAAARLVQRWEKVLDVWRADRRSTYDGDRRMVLDALEQKVGLVLADLRIMWRGDQ